MKNGGSFHRFLGQFTRPGTPQGPVGAAKVMIYAMLTGRISDAIHLDLQQARGERSNAEQGQGTAGCSPNRLAILF